MQFYTYKSYDSRWCKGTPAEPARQTLVVKLQLPLQNPTIVARGQHAVNNPVDASMSRTPSVRKQSVLPHTASCCCCHAPWLHGTGPAACVLSGPIPLHGSPHNHAPLNIQKYTRTYNLLHYHILIECCTPPTHTQRHYQIRPTNMHTSKLISLAASSLLLLLLFKRAASCGHLLGQLWCPQRVPPHGWHR